MTTPQISQFGLVDYQTTYQRMAREIKSPSFQEEIWLLNHPAVFTLGTAADESHVINPHNIPVIKTDRGGEVTYHGPGQLVAYFLLDVRERKLGPKALVKKLEDLISSILLEKDIESHFVEDSPGVYVEDKKIGSIGLRISSGKSYHGISLNVDMDLSPFNFINPCGYEGLEVTQIKEFDSETTLEEVESITIKELMRVFQ